MKHLIKNTILLATLSAFILTSCVNDLNTLPLNETDKTSETAYVDAESYLQGLRYIYGYWALVSQNDPGNSDIAVSDAGQSELIRAYMILNELPTDSFKIIWGDSYIKPIQYHTWTSTDNEAIIAAYTRCMKGITLVNEYLIQTEHDKIKERGHQEFADKIEGYRAEARFNRAYYYYLLLDLFGNPPFAMPENIGGDYPSQMDPDFQTGRTKLYEWIEAELQDLCSDGSAMPEKSEVQYPQASKATCHALLAKLYLNAEVYTKTAQWQKAKDEAAAAIAAGYTLHDNYQELFMQDNSTNGATEEFIFGICYDKDNTQSWGGTTHLVSASLNDKTNALLGGALGTGGKLNGENWNGYHVADDYVANFELNGIEWGNPENTFGYNRATSDKRAFFCNNGNTKEFDNTTTDTGWRCWKFSGLRSDGTAISDESETNYKFSSIDFPLIRLPEMYLIYAEADARLNGGIVSDATAKDYIKALRDRAGVAMPSDNDLTLDWLLKENAREFMWEGHRRTDLIRYGYFTSMSFPWTLKGGVMDGKVALPEYRTVYPIISSDLDANPNLKQNPGY